MTHKHFEPTKAHTYLGDGLYASHEGAFMLWLHCDREEGEHYVGLEPEVFESLLQYAMTIGWLKRGEPLR